MILIIAEKPSLAANIAAGIGNMKKTPDYYEGGKYLVTWVFGHLFSLCDIEAYTGPTTDGRWSMENLPCFPETFRFTLRPGKDKQPDPGIRRRFEAVKRLCERPDVDTIVNAGDADREGEIIVRLCISHTNAADKPCCRLWLPDQTPETVAAALAAMPPESEYAALADEGYARTYIDWLYGVNLTRLATLKTGRLLRVGRVIVPIVKAICDRDREIRSFTPQPYYALVSREETKGEVVELVSKHRFDGDDYDRACRAAAKLNAQTATVTAVKSRKDTVRPPKLFSLSTLQNYLGKKFKMSMDESLASAQRLYEAGYLTYPRTNSEYLATNEKEKIRKILAGVARLGYPVAFREDKTVFDDKKIESHSALTPTYKLPQPSALNETDKKVYTAVLRRFVAVFCSDPCTARRTEMTVSVGPCEDFTLKGIVLLTPGWTKFDDSFRGGRVLPDLKKGDEVVIDFKPTEKRTSPPKHYTIETLNNYLKNPFREEKAAAREEPAPGEEADDAEDYRAVFEGLELGTEATRTGIIENAIKSKYIELRKDVYRILPGGEFLIDSLARMGISMDKYRTVELGKALKAVYGGRQSVSDAVSLAEAQIREAFAAPQNDAASPDYTGFFREPLGVCPLCGGTVAKSPYGYSCDGYREKGCKYGFFDTVAGRTLTVAEARQLLNEGRTGLLSGFVSRAGNPFSAALRLEAGRLVFDFPRK